MSAMNVLNSYLISLMFFWVLFSGNALVFDFFPVYLGVIPLLVFSCYTLKIYSIYISLNSFIVFLLTVFPFFYISVYLLDHNMHYGFWPIYSLVTFIGVAVVHKAIDLNRVDAGLLSIVFFFITALLMLGAGLNIEDGRGMFVFGPNILYRIFACGGIMLLFWSRNFRYKKTLSIFVLMYFLLGMYITNSRGAFIVLPVILLACLHFTYNQLKVYLLLVLLFLVVAGGVCINFYIDNTNYGSRLLSFSYSDNIRFAPWLYLMDNFWVAITRFEFSYQFFYDNFVELPGFQYPHNIILEFLFYYELLGLCMIAFILMLFSYSFIMVFRMQFDFSVTLFYISLVIFGGAMLSGDLSDNFPALSLVLYLYFYYLKKNSILRRDSYKY
jgi:hypothetical protein